MKKQEETRKKRTQRDYSMAFKLQVIGEVERGELNQDQAGRKYGIQGNSTILQWIRKHGTLDWKELPTVSHQKTPEQKIKELEAKVANLEGELGRRSLDIGFFESALRKVEELRRSNERPGGTPSTKKSATGRNRKAN